MNRSLTRRALALGFSTGALAALALFAFALWLAPRWNPFT